MHCMLRLTHAPPRAQAVLAVAVLSAQVPLCQYELRNLALPFSLFRFL